MGPTGSVLAASLGLLKFFLFGGFFSLPIILVGATLSMTGRVRRRRRRDGRT